MGMSNGEANAFNTVVRYFLDIPSHAGKVSEGQAWSALLLLREKAYMKLAAGVTVAEMLEGFSKHAADRDGDVSEGDRGAS